MATPITATRLAETRASVEGLVPTSDAEAKELRTWLDVMQRLSEWPVVWRGPPHTKVFCTRSFELIPSGELDAASWCVAHELLGSGAAGRARVEAANRVIPLADVLTKACPSCGSPALVIARDREWSDSAADIRYQTDLLALCSRAPHVATLATSAESHYPASF